MTSSQVQIAGVLDLGASSGKAFAAVWDEKKLKLVEVHRFAHHPETFYQPSQDGSIAKRHCWNLGSLYGGMKDSLAKLAQQYGTITSFGIDTWGSDGGWLSAEGDVLNLIATGRDERWQAAREEILQIVPRKLLFKQTGLQSHPFNVLNQVYWYARHQRDLVHFAETYMPIHSLLNYYLTGVRCTEHTWMSTTQLCALGCKQYDSELFTLLNLPLAKMPEIVSPGWQVGPCCQSIAEEFSLPPFKIIVPSVHDTACAFASTPCVENRSTMILSTGTWFLAGVVLDNPILSEKAYEHGFANEQGYQGIRFLKNIMGTWPIQRLRQEWSRQDGKDIPWPVIEEIAQTAEPFVNNLPINDETLFSPANMSDAILALLQRTNQPLPSSRSQLARTVYEALAMEVARTSHLLSDILEKPIEEIVIVGGATKSNILCQWIADAAGVPVRVGPADATACGNAIVQAVSLGWVESIQQGCQCLHDARKEIIFMPQNHSAWQEVMARQKTVLTA